MNYDAFEALIHKRAQEFSQTTGHHKADLVSEGNKAFIKACNKYDENKGTKFSTFFYRVLTNALIDYTKKTDVPPPHEAEDNDFLFGKAPSADRSCILKDSIRALSAEARHVAHIFLSTPAEILSLTGEESYWQIRGKLTKHLRERHGWSYNRVYSACHEIRDMLKEMPR